MQIHLHQTHHTLADFASIRDALKSSLQQSGLHLFPELFLTGYPLADLCLMAPFIEHYQQHLEQLNDWLLKLAPNEETAVLLGGLRYQLATNGVPEHIYNVIYEGRPGQKLKEIYQKRLLPNYDIFDEQKYFTPGRTPGVWEWQGKKIGLMICEDMWASSFHQLDPAMDLARLEPLDAIINLSASPYDVTKPTKRLARARTLSHLLKAPFFYINRVGGEDEILFDGRSFVVNGDDVIAQAPAFCTHTLVLSFPTMRPEYLPVGVSLCDNTWESLFAAGFSTEQMLPKRLAVWTDEECLGVCQALQFGLQEYAEKNGFKKFLVALSGGMDSALVLTLAKLSLRPGQSIEAIYMPGNFSSPLSWDLASQQCTSLGMNLTSLPIKFLHANVRMAFQSNFSAPFAGLTDENVQSRLRGLLLYTRSNQTGAMVINTSNKSEIAVGYSTQYGDAVGALSLLGDLYKTEVYRLAQWLNTQHRGLIPEGIMTRPPSAELRENQTDQDSLPAYERLDTMLEGVLSYRYTVNDLVALGFTREEVNRVFQLYIKAEYKRRQFPPILKIKAKSFGFGHRVPLTKDAGIFR